VCQAQQDLESTVHRGTGHVPAIGKVMKAAVEAAVAVFTAAHADRVGKHCHETCAQEYAY